jgi:hypothetical protein
VPTLDRASASRAISKTSTNVDAVKKSDDKGQNQNAPADPVLLPRSPYSLLCLNTANVQVARTEIKSRLT